MEFSLRIKEHEYWWGGAVSDGYKMPLTTTSKYYLDVRVNSTYNQFNGVFLSSKGRYIVFEGGAEITVTNGTIYIKDSENEIFSGEGFANLKEVQKYVADTYFFNSNRMFDTEYIVKPQYCTWVETLKNVTADKLMQYAESTRNNGLSGKLLIIDDGWSNDYGDWTFNVKKFPNAKEVIQKVKSLGFDVALWVVPFVNETCPDYAYLQESGGLVKNKEGKIHFAEWWNGKSAVLDMSSAVAVKWVKEKLDNLITMYGVVGFKFDAGDAMYYPESSSVPPNEQSRLWAEFGSMYPYAELRACVGLGGYPVIQRLSDKSLSWEKGMKILIPNIMQAGLLGYYYCCGDMVGGGNSADYENLQNIDTEFYIRSCQCASLFPIVQFSYSIWNKSEELKKTAVSLCELRKKFSSYICGLIKRAQEQNEPIVRNLEYEFPNMGCWEEKQCFMLGEKYLIAPVVEKGTRKKKITLPPNCVWKYLQDGKTYENVAEIDCDIDTLPIFERQYDIRDRV